MSIPELVKSVTDKGAVLILAAPNKLRVRGVSRLDSETVETLRRHGKDLILYLKSQTPAPCDSRQCAGCYEVEPGRRIHPPRPSPEWQEWLARWTPQEGTKTQ